MADRVRELVLLVNGERAGVVGSQAGRLSLRYEPIWVARPDATPVSLSMPLVGGEYGHALVAAFLRGLLPDNELVLERWARTYQVSPTNPFALLCHVGEDCAGAVQFVRPERVDALAAGDGGVKWLTEPEVADRLRELRRDPSAWHVHDTGQFRRVRRGGTGVRAGRVGQPAASSAGRADRRCRRRSAQAVAELMRPTRDPASASAPSRLRRAGGDVAR